MCMKQCIEGNDKWFSDNTIASLSYSYSIKIKICNFAAVLKSMVGQRSGHIVGISSIQGKIALPYR